MTPRLKFDVDQLKGKTSAVELSKRVNALSTELASFEQGEVDRQSVESICPHLIAVHLLHHKDRSVKAYLACCLADVLSLLAPDPPWSSKELEDIFAFIFRQLKNLGKPSDIHHVQYAYLLESLSKAKSACLLPSLEHSEAQIVEVFKDFFDTIGPDTSPSCAQCMSDILSQLLDESTAVQSSTIELLLAQFQAKSVRLKPTSYQLATRVCQASSDRLQRYVSSYFTDVFVSAKETKLEGDEEEAFRAVEKAHELIVQLNRAVPSLLLNIIPALEEGLKVEDVRERTLTVKSLGRMFADRAGLLDHLAKRYPASWRAWLGRTKDKVSTVRATVLDCIGPIWTAHSDIGSAIQEIVLDRLVDTEEKVRLAACHIFKMLDFDVILHQVEASMLKSLAERIRDRKPAVSLEALESLSKMFNLAYADIVTGDVKAIEQFAWIPEHLLLSWASTDVQMQTSVESVLLQHILPLPTRSEDSEAWFERFFTVYRTLSPKTRSILQKIAHLQTKRPTIFARFLDACETYNGGVIDDNAEAAKKKMLATCHFVSQAFPDSKKANEGLVKFAKMNENRIYRLLRSLMDPACDLKTFLKNYAESTRRIDQSSATLSDLFSTFILRSGHFFINQTFVPFLLAKVEAKPGPADADTQLAADLLKAMASGVPEFFKPHLPELWSIFYQEQDESDAPASDAVLAVLVNVAAHDAKAIVFSDEIRQRLSLYLLHGLRQQPKYAAIILARDDAQYTRPLIKKLNESLLSAAGYRLAATLAALNQFVKYAEMDAPITTKDALAVVYEELLEPSKEAMEVDQEDWLPTLQLSLQQQARCLAIKLLTNVECKRSTGNGIDERFLNRLLYFLDAASEQTTFSIQDMARLRLQSARAVLKLWSNQRTAAFMLHRLFRPIALIAQDPIFEVRNVFLSKLVGYLAQRRLTDPHCNLILLLTALDPETENTAIAKSSMLTRLARCTPEQRLVTFELLFVRLLHHIAHHPDFSQEDAEIVHAVKYIDFYLNLIASQDNIGLLMHLATRVKTIRDSESQGHSEHLYMLSDIAQVVVTAVAHHRNWTLASYPGTIKLPSDIFRSLPSQQVQNEIAKRAFLSDNSIKLIQKNVSNTKSNANGETKKVTKPESENKPKRKRAATNAQVKTKKARKAKPDWAGSSSDRDPDPSSESDEEQASKRPRQNLPTEKALRKSTRVKKRTRRNETKDVEADSSDSD